MFSPDIHFKLPFHNNVLSYITGVLQKELDTKFQVGCFCDFVWFLSFHEHLYLFINFLIAHISVIVDYK